MTQTAREMTLALLAARQKGATVCPSEVARAIASNETWRDAMPAVHSAIDGLIADGRVYVSWKGKELATRAGPYRIAIRGDD